jgi:DNA-binding NtrC family response regulator
MVMQRLRDTEATRRRQSGRESTLADIVAVAPKMRAVREAAALLARARTPVLVTGPAGAGKEALARAIHRHGDRATRPFLVVNCAATPSGLLERELFGIACGPGREADTGLIGRCDRGTLFLDEATRIAPPTQERILSLLETGRYSTSPGDAAPRHSDVRLILAWRELPPEDSVSSGLVDALASRFGAASLRVPALAERSEDIVPLAHAFLQQLEREIGRPAPALSPDAASYLKTRVWLGNVRELRNSIERAVIATSGARLTSADFRNQVAPSAPQPAGAHPWILPPEGIDLEALNRALTEQALGRTGDKISPAARLLGMSRATLRYRVRTYGLERKTSKPTER